MKPEYVVKIELTSLPTLFRSWNELYQKALVEENLHEGDPDETLHFHVATTNTTTIYRFRRGFLKIKAFDELQEIFPDRKTAIKDLNLIRALFRKCRVMNLSGEDFQDAITEDYEIGWMENLIRLHALKR